MSSFHLPETILIAVAKPFSVGLFTSPSLPAGNHLRLRAYWRRASPIIALPRTTSEPSVRQSNTGCPNEAYNQCPRDCTYGIGARPRAASGGYRTTVRNRTAEKTGPLASAGATVAASVRFGGHGSAPDLLHASANTHALIGLKQDRAMLSFKSAVAMDELEAIQTFITNQSWNDYERRTRASLARNKSLDRQKR